MKSGFYSVSFADHVHEDGSAEQGFGVAILAHLKDGRFVGVDQGGCKLTGTYERGADGETAVRLLYAFKAGSQLPNGMVLERDTAIPSAFVLAASAAEGAPQMVDIGTGPVLVRLEWLADPA
jgi:hypothetical protein